MDLPYTQLCKTESYGNYGAFGVRIEVAATQLSDLKQPSIKDAAYRAMKAIEAEVMAAVVAENPESTERSQIEREQLISCFPQPIFVEEIPNGYCSQWCCRHLPWFVVTTTIGRFVIGWRRRVISIDWTQTRGTATASELFPNEDVTKGERDIHAWSAEDARRYIEAVIASAKPQ